MTEEHASSCLEPSSLEYGARRSLASQLGLDEAQIATRSNSEKYAIASGARGERYRLAEIVGLMRQLNQAAVSDPSIGAAEGDPVGLRDLLTTAALEIAHACEGGRYHWVELGPEPSKTRYLMERLGDIGAMPATYTSVDINPESAALMKGEVGPFFAADAFRTLNADYDTLDAAALAFDEAPLVLTHLGFQEGNDTPANTRERLLRLTRPGDFVLSEMQVVADGGLSGIGAFYARPEMRRFSELTARSIAEVTLADYAHFVVPVEVQDQPPVLATVCAHAVDRDARSSGNSNAAALAWIMTNVCIKFSARQFRTTREQGGHFSVLWQGTTGDRTIAAQLAMRT